MKQVEAAVQAGIPSSPEAFDDSVNKI